MLRNLSIFNFKNLKFALKISTFILLIIPFVIYAGNKYAAASTENLINTYNEKRFNEFYELPKNTVDMLFLGSSHSYCTFDPEIFDNLLGTSSYQLGMPLQHLDSTYFTLLEALNYQSPKVIVLEVYWDMLDDKFQLNQAGMLFQVLRNSALEERYIKEVFPVGEKIRYNVKLLRYQADYFAFRNNELKKNIIEHLGVTESKAQKQDGIEEYRSKGYTYCDYNMLEDEYNKTNQFKNSDGRNFQPEQVQMKYLQKIVDLTKKEGIELIFVTAPIANISFEYIKNYDIIHKFIQDFAEKNTIPYYDYNLINADEKLLTNTNFRDDAHLNHSGVEIVDNHFAKILQATAEL